MQPLGKCRSANTWGHSLFPWQLLAEHADNLHLTSGFEATINKFDSNFSTHLLDLLDKLSVYSTNDCEHSMLNIIYR